MKIGIRLSREAMSGIEELKKIYQESDALDEMRITNGATIGLALRELKKTNSLENWDWESVIFGNQFVDKNSKAEKSEIRTSLTLNDDIIKDIEKLKKIFPNYTMTKYVTTSYVIRIIVRAALMQKNKI